MQCDCTCSIFVETYRIRHGRSTSVCPLPVWPVLIAATAVFVAVCVCLSVQNLSNRRKNSADTHDLVGCARNSGK